MYKQKNILAIIPARGGSKTILNKNIVKLNKQPLLSYSIQQAKQSKYIDRFIVSSDSETILTVAKKYGSETLLRPKKFARDTSKMDEALHHVLVSLHKKEGYQPDFIVLLQPTSPLRSVATIDKAITLFVTHARSFDSLTAVCEQDPKIGTITKGVYRAMNRMNMQRQELAPLYKECGTVFVFKPERILKKKTLYGNKILPFIIPSKEEALDINDADDLTLAHYYITL